MERYKKHIFICENKREDGHARGSCASTNSMELRPIFKEKLKELNLLADVRPNGCVCLDACEHGNVVVVYPEQVWYGNVTVNDIDEIIESHIKNDKVVERLTIKDKKFNKDKEHE